jgi:hypothetical protein
MMFDYDYHAYPLLGYHGEAAALIPAPRRNVTTITIIEVIFMLKTDLCVC